MTPRSKRAATRLIKKIATPVTLAPTKPKRFTTGVTRLTYIRNEGKTVMLIRLSSHIWRVCHEYVAHSVDGEQLFWIEYDAKTYGNWREANADYLGRCK